MVLLDSLKTTNGVTSHPSRAGWRFSDERFMLNSKNVLDDAKIRVSYGITGNEAIRQL